MRYVSKNVISFSVKVKGREENLRVSFTACSHGGSTYTTDLPNVVEALESSKMFGSVYFRAPECKETVTAKKKSSAKKVESKVVAVESVKTWQDAIEYLVDKCNSKVDSLSSPEGILKEAEAKKVSFPNLNTNN